MPLLDKTKFDYLYDHFPEFLRKHCGEKNPGNWHRSKLDPLNIQQGSYSKLAAALSEITDGGLQNADVLLFDPDDEKRKKSLEDFKKKLKEHLGKQPDKKPKSPTRKRSNTRSQGHGLTSFDAPTEHDQLPTIARYRHDWNDIFEALFRTRNSDDFQQSPSILRRIQKLEKFRLDRFVSPSIQWRRGKPTMSRKQNAMDEDWETVQTQDWNRTASFVIGKLRKAPLVIMHDDAGMGKSAFSWMLFHFILSSHSKDALAVRIEGVWPRRSNSDGSNTPLTLREILVEEILGYRENGNRVPGHSLGEDALHNANEELDALMKNGNVYILLDGLDQMSPEDRTAAMQALRQSLDRIDGILNCHWLVSGRPFAFRSADQNLDQQQVLFDEQCLRLRLSKFDERQQRQYFEDLEKDPFFATKKITPLDYLCSGWKKEATAEDLGIPLHLSEIRRIIEAAKDFEEHSPIQGEKLSVIHGSSDLHARVSDVYLKRALEKTAVRSNDAPLNPNEKLRVLRHICSTLAMQMMLDGNYNASIDFTTSNLDSYRGVRPNKLVSTYLRRCEDRYKQSLNEDTSYWNWGIDVLQQIEVTHRGDIDIFQDDCRSFRDTKAMEWYAAFYLANYFTQSQWDDGLQESGKNRIRDFLGDESWTRCWRMAMELPDRFYEESHLEDAIRNVLRKPSSGNSRSKRCEWMWIAWNNRLEQDAIATQRKISPLQRANKVIEGFRQEFNMLIEAEYSCALTLRFNADRDSPDLTLTIPNQTKNGWYRRIPDVGDYSMFRGERPAEVTVSPFLLRKFVVTNDEYRLFDPMHRSPQNGGDLPATGIDWYMATMFCHWLGSGYRLPTEAEWETACCANQLNDGKLQKETKYWFGEDDSLAKKHMWFSGNSNGRPHSLAESNKASGHENRFGLVDMSGNVWEWCSDRYGDYAENTVSDPVGPTEGSDRVFRGGSWSREAAFCRSAYRRWLDPSDRNRGFRVALSASRIPK
jgi:formylglycine-generating enzyme required for sulfatase activity